MPSSGMSRAWGRSFPRAVLSTVQDVARRGSTPLVVSDGPRVLGVIELKDIVKGGISERFGELRRMGIKTVMITGDNPLTAAAIAAGVGRRRFSRRSDPGSQAETDPRAPGGRPAGRDDRRRHQRCPGARPGGRGGRHEYRHAGRQGSGQHGRSRFEPDQAHRGGRDRQADADDARRAHHLLDRQRRRQVLRHHPGGVRHHLSAAERAQRHAPGEPVFGDPLPR